MEGYYNHPKEEREGTAYYLRDYNNKKLTIIVTDFVK
jgi:hypothetical protein